jgi:hypothetical protein
MPIPVPLFSPAVPSVMADPTAPAAGSPAQGGLMSSPFAAPFLYSSMLQATQPLSALGSTASGSTTSGSTTSGSTTSGSTGARWDRGLGVGPGQIGLLMLATQQNPGAVGSGQLSGSRPGLTQRNAQNAGTPATAKRRSVARPGGLAARYFNRVGGHTPYPQSYFNRQSRYFP